MNKREFTLTKEQKKIFDKNRRALRKKHGIQGNKNLVLHHIDDTLRFTDVDRYCEWREEDVVVMTRSEHSKLHQELFKKDSYYSEIMSQACKGNPAWNKGKHYKQTKKHAPMSEERKQQISEFFKGKPKSEEQKRKMSEARLKNSEQIREKLVGRHWFHNGEIQVFRYECPEGFVKGRLPGALDNANKERLKRYAELKPNEA